MVMTPEFSLTQDDKHIKIDIKLPYIKISSSEFYVTAHEFTFYLKPYLLKLQFEQALIGEDKVEKAVYDHNNYMLSVHILKKNEGEDFKDLDLIAKLLQPKAKLKKKAEGEGEKKEKFKFEVLSEEKFEDVEDGGGFGNVDGEFFDQNRYGFDRGFEDFFENRHEEIYELADFDPSEFKLEKRLTKVDEVLNAKFDPEHYLCDLFESEMIDPKMDYKLKIDSKEPEYYKSKPLGEMLSKQENDAMLRIGNKKQLLGKKSIQNSKMMIIDLIFSYCYENRCMDLELSCESPWSVNKLSPTLCSFIYFDNCQEAIAQNFRRAMCYPIHRSFKLALKVQKDVSDVLKVGKRLALKILLGIKCMFERSEPRYMLNLLFVDDLVIFCQNVTDEEFEEMAGWVEEVTVCKSDLGLKIPEYEKLALDLQKEEEEGKLEEENN